MSLFTKLFSSPGLKVKYDGVVSNHVVKDRNNNIKFIGTKDSCEDFIKSSEWGFHS